MRALTRNLDFVSEVSKAVTALGWDNYATDHEDANGQFEQNFQFADALTTCDRAVFFRYMVESLAQQRGLIATFMPKPFAHLTGNGCHFHVSLWKDGENVFERDPSEDPRGLGLSELAYNFIGGLKANAKAYIALTAPTVNSYKRLVVGAPTSGATWAPGLHQLRLQQPHADAAHPGRRAGSRTARSTARATRTWPPPRCWPPGWTASSAGSTPATRTRPTCTAERRGPRGAGDRAAARQPARRHPRAGRQRRAPRRLGKTRDGDYVDYFIEVKQREVQAAHEQITQWELDRYLQLF